MPSIPAALTLALLVASTLAAGPDDISSPSFEIASVRLNDSQTGVDHISNTGGFLRLENVSLKRLIAMAFDIPESQDYLFSGPDWLDSENYDIQARYPPDTTNPDFLLMFQRLLRHRFAMQYHREPRELTILALVQSKAKNDHPTLHPAANPGSPYKFKVVAGHASASSISMLMLTGRLSRPGFGLDRPVLDFTNLPGTFDLTLDWKVEPPDGNASPDAYAPGTSIFAAIEEQLGLKLERRQTSLQILVIDHANRIPTSN